MKSFTIKDIPDEDLKKFRAFCSLQGMTMNSCIKEFIKNKGSKVHL